MVTGNSFNEAFNKKKKSLTHKNKLLSHLLKRKEKTEIIKKLETNITD